MVKKQRNLSITIKFAFWIVLLLILLQLINSIILIDTRKKEITSTILFNAELFAEYNSEEIVEHYLEYKDKDHTQIYKLLDEILKKNKEIKGIYLIQADGKILLSPENLKKRKLHKKFNYIKDKHILKRISAEKKTIEIIEIEGKEYLDIIFPYVDKNGGKSHSVRFIFHFETLEREIGIMKTQILLIGIFCVIVGIILIVFLSNKLTKPIKNLLLYVKRISKGDFSADIKINSKDEIGELSVAFSQMQKDLFNNFNELIATQENLKELNQTLEQKVKERTLELKEKNKQLKELSITDKLTGLNNRMKLDETLADELKRFKRYKHPFAVILFDIDHFKKVNDTYGHNIGDEVLIEIARLLKLSVRKTDTVGRWGGEEFMVICPEISKEGALNLANKIRQTIQTHEFDKIGYKTASFGVSICNLEDTISELTARADEALYKAKNNGRNKVEYK